MRRLKPQAHARTPIVSIKPFMEKSRHDKTGGHGMGVGGRLRQRLAQILLHSFCSTTLATAFLSVASSANAAAATGISTTAASRQEPPPLCAHEQRSKPIDGRPLPLCDFEQWIDTEIKEEDKKYLRSMKEWDAERKELLEKRRQERQRKRSAKNRWKGGMLPNAERRGSRSLSVFAVRKQQWRRISLHPVVCNMS
ncbi:uncharacterized protein C2845_PM02G14780 [Panicum miliaceum]|uniref:Uncharacterized protein n=1 Tax=Panicum miliaceum TaxID=4540 RepID=A0A3L6S977_PANMI|nr:uncharacterized protein C2845_PM02G14780 [Panicum miliaceum]